MVNKFIEIDNEVLEKMSMLPLNGSQFRIIFAIWNYTFGLKRNEYELSVNFISDVIGMKRRQMQRELRPLIEGNIILVKQAETRRTPRVLGFNNDFALWQIDVLKKLRRHKG